MTARPRTRPVTTHRTAHLTGTAYHTGRAAAAVAVALGAGALFSLTWPADPAGAHPFGPPSTARISVEGSRVAIAWIAAEDDWFDGPAEVVDVDVTLGALTDLNEAYRTMLTSQTPAEPGRTLFTSTEPTQRLRFTSDGAGSGSAGRRGALVGGGVALVTALGTLVTVRLLRRVRSRP